MHGEISIKHLIKSKLSKSYVANVQSDRLNGTVNCEGGKDQKGKERGALSSSPKSKGSASAAISFSIDKSGLSGPCIVEARPAVSGRTRCPRSRSRGKIYPCNRRSAIP